MFKASFYLITAVISTEFRPNNCDKYVNTLILKVRRSAAGLWLRYASNRNAREEVD